MTDPIDLESTREKYAFERARRIRNDGLEQFAYSVDPEIDPAVEIIERDALTDHVDAIVIGGGLGGLTAAVRLRQAGLDRIRIVDRASDVGGTWYWNCYPGAQCDIESYIYLPYLEETGFIPREKYSYQQEILGHLKNLATKFDLYKDAAFQTEVTKISWDELTGIWTVRTNRGDVMTARYVVMAAGFLQRPKLPAVEGLEGFEGDAFHTSRWDYSVTGGEPGPDGGGLPLLADKRVAVIGTGATSLQCVPPLGAYSEHLYVIQRTPTVVFERNNAPTDPDWAASLKPGWQEERAVNFSMASGGMPVDVDMVSDGWTKLFGPVGGSWGRGLFGTAEDRERAEQIDAETMSIAHQRVSSIVEDPATAEALKAYYRIPCKRVGYHDEYLQTFNRPNVTLVDSAGRGLERVTKTGVVVNGDEIEIDVLVFATGFDTRDTMTTIGIEIVGRDGLTLAEHWKHGMRTFHGLHSHGFPNLFVVGLTQTATGNNFAHTLWHQSNHVGYIVDQMRRRGLSVIEATKDSQDAWVDLVNSTSPDTYRDFLYTCTPGYYNNEGDVENENRFGSTQFLAGPLAFFGMLADWRDEGSMAGLTVT